MPISVISGIKCSEDVPKFFDKLKSKRQYRYVSFKIRSGTRDRSIVLDKCGARDSTFLDFANELPKGDARYAVFDFSYITSEYVGNDGHALKDGLLFIFWCPFTYSHVEGRTIYSSSKASILAELRKGTSLKQIEVTDFEDLTEANLLNALKPLRDKELDLDHGKEEESKN